jgi:hypothetical protein
MADFSMDPKDFCAVCCRDWVEGDVPEHFPAGVAPTIDPLDHWYMQTCHQTCIDRKVESLKSQDKAARDRIDREKAHHDECMAIMGRIEGHMDHIKDSLKVIEAEAGEQA